MARLVYRRRRAQIPRSGSRRVRVAERHRREQLMATRYTGNVPSNVGKDAKYSVVRRSAGWEIRLIFRLSAEERALVTTSSHPELIELVNAVKEDVNGVPGGAFYINEY